VTLSPAEDGQVPPHREDHEEVTHKKGVTDAVRVTLSDGASATMRRFRPWTSSRQVFAAGKNSETNFKDTYRYNIGGYQLARCWA
jgi:hypothetical protein